MNVDNRLSRGLAHPAKPVHWQEGLFLQPQHFQWQDLYLQSQIDPLNRFLQPAFWGTGSIVVQEEALSNCVFKIISGEFRFRDMTHAIYPGNAVIEPRDFEKAWKDKGKPFTVYLGVRRLSPNGKNVSAPGDYEAAAMIPTRYATEAESEHLADLYESGEPLPVDRLHYVLKLFWEQETDSIGDYEIMPVARLESRKGEVILSTAYIPPALSIFSSKVLMQTISSVNERITATAHRLESYKQDRGVHSAEFGTKDMVFLLTLRTLNRFSPLLRHMLGKPAAVHPWSVYGLICQLVGELSTFSARINLVNIDKNSGFYLPDYDHENLTQCFRQCREMLEQLMADIASEPEYVIPFTDNGQYFIAELNPDWTQGRKRFYLAVTTEAPRDQVISELEDQAQVSAPEQLSMLMMQSLRGIELDYMLHPPPELPRRSMGLYFVLNHKHRLWAKILETQQMAIAWDTCPEDVRIELMVTGGRD